MSETFRPDQVRSALRAFIAFGESSLFKCHQGYFAYDGWAARCLRWHLEQLEKPIIEAYHPDKHISQNAAIISTHVVLCNCEPSETCNVCRADLT